MRNLREVYLDNSATTKVSNEAVKVMVDVMTNIYGNPSSLHSMGIEAEKILKDTRTILASALGISPKEIYFTSGGTESNNLAIKGVVYGLRRRGNHLITTAIEHPSVLDVFKRLEPEGFDITYLDVDKWGQVDINQLKEAMTPDTILVSMMYVNSEVGSVLPIEAAGKIVKEHSNALFHVDAVQAFGKIPLISKLKNIDMLSMSSHKIYGPKGVGAVFIRKNAKILPLFEGGGQELGIRSGTENVPGIAGFGKAVEEIIKNFSPWTLKMAKLKEYLKNRILDEIPDVIVNSPENGAPHILNISFLGTKGEVILHSLESHGIYVSTGSACSSNKKGKSHVLSAMGKTDEEIDGAVRFSFSPFLDKEDIDYTVEKLKKSVGEVRRFLR